MAHDARPRTKLPTPDQRIELVSGLRVSPVCVGMVTTPDIIPTAYDAGVNFFLFSADMHWTSYQATRRGLEALLARGRGLRESIVVAVVCYLTQPEFCTLPFLDALNDISGLQYIDLLVAGGVYGHEFPYRLPVYRSHREHGLAGARGIGATFHDRHAARDAITQHLVDIALVRYNPLHTGAREDVFPALIGTDLPLVYNFNSTVGYVSNAKWARMANRPDWRPRPTDYYRFALTRPEVDGILCSLSTAQEVRQLNEALHDRPLLPEEELYMARLAAAEAAGQGH